jgi:hypothetical protein
MIARVKAGAPLVEHHRDAADAGKRRALIHGRRVSSRDRRRLRPTPRRSPQAPGRAPACSLIGVLAHLNLPPHEKSLCQVGASTDRSSRRLQLADGSGSSSVAARGRIGILVGCGSRTNRSPRRLRLLGGAKVDRLLAGRGLVMPWPNTAPPHRSTTP